MPPKVLDSFSTKSPVLVTDETVCRESERMTAYDGRINHLNAPPKVAGLFDAEVSWSLSLVRCFGKSASGLVLRAPAEVVGWVFGDNGPIAQFERN